MRILFSHYVCNELFGIGICLEKTSSQYKKKKNRRPITYNKQKNFYKWIVCKLSNSFQLFKSHIFILWYNSKTELQQTICSYKLLANTVSDLEWMT